MAKRSLNDEQRKLVEDNVNLAYKFVHTKAFTYNIEFEDKISIALLALVKAALLYKPEKGTFSTYAYLTMQTEFNMLYRQMKIKYLNENNITFCSLQSPLIENPELCVVDTILDTENKFEDIDTMIYFSSVYNKLKEKDKQIIDLRLKGLTQRQIAEQLSISQASVSRIITKFIKKFLSS